MHYNRLNENLGDIMFLNRLVREEKVAFLELAHYMARIDGDFAENELETIKIYCAEMNIENIKFDSTNFSLEKCLETFKDKNSKKIVLMELMALIYSDDNFDEKERIAIKTISNKFNFDNNTVFIYEQWSKAMLALYMQGEALLQN